MLSVLYNLWKTTKNKWRSDSKMLWNNQSAFHSAAPHLQGGVTFLLRLLSSALIQEKELGVDQRIRPLYRRVQCVWVFLMRPTAPGLHSQRLFLWRFNFNTLISCSGLIGVLIVSFRAVHLNKHNNICAKGFSSVPRVSLCARRVWAHLRVAGNSLTSPHRPLRLMLWCSDVKHKFALKFASGFC